MKITLPVRMFASYAAVVAVGALATYLTVRLLAPRLFDDRMGAMNGAGRGMGMGGTNTDAVHAAFRSAVNTSLIVGLLVSVAVAALVAIAVTGRLLRPLNAVRAATKDIAGGNYTARVPPPGEPELAALASDVNSLAVTLADTESRRTRLLGDVAHEMRTPLTTLDGYVEGLIDGVFAPDPELLASLDAELHRLHRLADDLSNLSRTEERGLELHPVDADLAHLARRGADRLAPQFADAHVSLNVQAGAPLPVRADTDRITQVLTNLLGNALVATPAGGSVILAALRRGDRGQVRVTDTGVGLDPDDLQRVFERFYRAPNATRRSAGSGIGLTIARGIARAHRGDITAASPGQGHGATFTLTLPLR
jgi:signal transduction histidine kinase